MGHSDPRMEFVQWMERSYSYERMVLVVRTPGTMNVVPKNVPTLSEIVSTEVSSSVLKSVPDRYVLVLIVVCDTYDHILE